jgi:phosphate transport system permease protein
LLSSNTSSLSRNDGILKIWTWFCAAIAGAVVLFILLFLLGQSTPLIGSLGIKRFFTDPQWHPVDGEFNLAPMILGSFLAALGAVAIAAPLGVVSALFMKFYAPARIAWVFQRVIELLAAIPSVVYGFWGLVVLVPFLNKWQNPGSSLLAGILILAIMILPLMTMAAETTFARIPRSYLVGAEALGLHRWSIVRDIVLPWSRPGLISGVILQLGRALGETMAILMVCGNVVQYPEGLFAPIRTLTANMALEMAYATGNHRSALYVSGLMLAGFVVILVWAASLIEGFHESA